MHWIELFKFNCILLNNAIFLKRFLNVVLYKDPDRVVYHLVSTSRKMSTANLLPIGYVILPFHNGYVYVAVESRCNQVSVIFVKIEECQAKRY